MLLTASLIILFFSIAFIAPIHGTILPAACTSGGRAVTDTPAIDLSAAAPYYKFPDDWLPGWTKRIKLTIEQDRIDEALTDFPILVHIGKSSGINAYNLSFIFDELDSDDKRRKIAVTTSDGKSQCHAEIEEWNSSNQEAWIWVKVPYIDSQLNTDLYLYFDKDAADNASYTGDTGTEAAQCVWDNAFIMVQHLNVDGRGAAGEFKDSTSKHIDGTGGYAPYAPPQRTSGKIGSGQYFNGINNYIEIPDNDSLSIDTTGYLTISGWISPAALNFTDSSEYVRWMGKGVRGEAEYHLRMYNQNTSATGNGEPRTNWISFYVFNPKGGLGAGGGGPVGHDLTPNEWIYFSASSDMIKSYMGFNGQPCRLADPWKNFKIRYVNGSGPLRIGTTLFDTNEWWYGRLDEIRISDVQRSDAWNRASYYSESDNLLYYSEPTTLYPVGLPTARVLFNQSRQSEMSLPPG
jgi:hypothetical protein